MTDLRKAAEMALEALESFRLAQNPLVPQSIYVLRKALAQPEQKPVDIHCPSCLHSFSIVPVAKRQWVSLTDEEIADAVGSPIDEVYLNDFRKVEAALRSKNDPAAN